MRTFYHIPTQKTYTTNGAGGIITEGTNVPLPLWLVEGSKDFQLITADTPNYAWPIWEAFEKLTELQNKVGYVPGDINTIALLGLFGEAGEVLAEVNLRVIHEEGNKAERFDQIVCEGMREDAVGFAKNIDDYKKKLRDKKTDSQVQVVLMEKNESAFDKEIANVLYYLNALAVNRGKPLSYYAGLAYEIVVKKSQQDISPWHRQ